MIVDPITVEVVRNAMTYIAEEMGIALRNSAYSHNIKERMDHSCALFSPKGELLAQAEHIPVHLGSLPWGLKNTLGYLAEREIPLEEGDMVVLNDPYIAGTHLNDVTVIQPIFWRGVLVGFSANKAHQVDVGGKTPGSISTDATELSHEGIVIPPVKILRRGEPVDDIFRLFAENVRTPEINMGDLRAQIAANRLGERGLLELVERYGFDELLATWEEILKRSEQRAQAEISTIPAGVYRAEDCLEDTGVSETPAWIRVTLKVGEGQVWVDFAGTDPQVAGPLNAVFGVTLSATYYAIKAVLDPEIPMNEGMLRTVKVSAPLGSLVNPRKPAPVSGGNLETSQRIADTVLLALAQAVPQRVPAASQGTMNNVMVGGYDPQRGRRWVFYETIGGGSGGRPGRDGVDGVHVNMTNTMNTPIEAMEQYYPLLFERYELRPGTGGPGKWRGGCGIIRAFRLLGPQATASILTERTRIPPWGLAGGRPGGLGVHYVIRADGTRVPLRGKATVSMGTGDVLVVCTPGGGGYGDPAERDPGAQEQDRLNGLVD